MTGSNEGVKRELGLAGKPVVKCQSFSPGAELVGGTPAHSAALRSAALLTSNTCLVKITEIACFSGRCYSFASVFKVVRKKNT